MKAINNLKLGGEEKKAPKKTTSARGVSVPNYRNLTPTTFSQQLLRKGILKEGHEKLSPEEINSMINEGFKIKEGFAAPYRVVQDKKGNLSYQKDYGRELTDYYDPETTDVVDTTNKPREGFFNGGSPSFGMKDSKLKDPLSSTKSSKNTLGSLYNANYKDVGNVSAGVHASKINNGSYTGEGGYEAIMSGVSKAGPVGAAIGAITAIGDAIGDPIRKKAEAIDKNTGEYKNKDAAIKTAAIGSFTNPLKSGMTSLSDPNATGKEKVLGFIGGPGGQKLRLDRLEEERLEAIKKENAKISLASAKDYINKNSYAKGGEIKGAGTGKSDSIKMDADSDGSFIVPVENAEIAKEYGKELLGWKNGESANKKGGDKKINVSDGEVYFTPEEVGTLKYHGIDLNELAPNADADKKMNYAEGGNVLGSEFRSDSKYNSYSYKNDDNGNVFYQKPGTKNWNLVTNKDATGEYNNYLNSRLVKSPNNNPELGFEKTTDNPAIPINKSKSVVNNLTLDMPDLSSDSIEGEKEKTKTNGERNIFSYVPELAGTIQTIAGAAGLMEAGKKPDMTVSKTLEKLSAETRRLANFGYEPAVLNALNNQIENTRRDVSKSITDSGGSPMEQMAKLQKLLGTTIDKKAGVTFENAKEKSRKYADVLKIDSAKAGQEFDISKINFEDYYRNQEVFANLLSSGIDNIVGARQLKNEQDALAKIKADAKFTL